MSVSFGVHPGELANALANAYEISKEKAKIVHCPHVLLTYQPDAEGKLGNLFAYGVGRYAGGRSKVVLESLPSTESFSVSLTREQADDLQSILRKIRGGKAAQVGVTIYPEPERIIAWDDDGVNPREQWVNLVISDGPTQIVELLDQDPAGESDRWFDLIDEVIASEGAPVGTPVVFSMDVIGRLGKIRATGNVIDLKKSSHDRLVAVAMGTEFRGVIADVGRELYLTGGRHGDGPGSPDHLF